MEQQIQLPGVKIEYPKPTYEQLEIKNAFISRKSNRRRAALKQIADAHLLLKYKLERLQRDYNSLSDEYDKLFYEFNELESENLTSNSKPFWKFW